VCPFDGRNEEEIKSEYKNLIINLKGITPEDIDFAIFFFF